jgi:Skp family chaperone for outer membrane proteins
LPTKFRQRQVVLATYYPSTPAKMEAVKAWLQVALNVVDLLTTRNAIKPEVSCPIFGIVLHMAVITYCTDHAQTTRKLQKTRQQVDADLQASYKKVLAEDAPVEETAEEKRAAKKRAERAALSEKERKRLEDLDKKREMRKIQKKQVQK